MRRWLLHAGLLVAAFIGGAVSSSPLGAARYDGDDTYRKLAVFARVLNYIENNYVAVVDPEPLIHGAIRGMLSTLDAHSRFMDPAQYAVVRSEAQGAFGGIGVEVAQRERRMIVVEVHPGTPAERAGLRAGDVIVAVDGRSVRGVSLSALVRRLKGPPGSSVQVSVSRGKARREQVTLTRSRIRVPSVAARPLASSFGYLRIRSFSERTAAEAKQALHELRERGPLSGLVLDLRDNPGGLVDQAVRVADTWLSRGVIVSTEGRTRAPDVERAHPKGTEPPYPIVILVNGGTASASEIVVGALRDHNRAVVVGTRTFGKGSVQTVIELEDRSALKLTIARYFTPKRHSIHKKGIVPDVVVATGPEEAQSETSGTDAGEMPDLGARIVSADPSTDPQLQAGLNALRNWKRGPRRGG